MGERLAVRLMLVLFAVTLALYAPAIQHDFLMYDDNPYVVDNPQIQRGLDAECWRWAWTTFHCSNWHPLTWLSHLLDSRLYGLDPRGHHLTSVLLHVANTVLLFVVLRQLTGAAWRSFLVAALFGWHPLHVESVAWVAERKDVLSTFFGLLGLGAYALYAERPGLFRYLLVVLALALSLLAKPMLVTLPCLLLVLDYWPLGRWQGMKRACSLTWLLLEKVPLLALSAASCAITILAQWKHAVVSVEHLPLQVRMANAVIAYVAYLRKTFWPTDLAIFYPHPGMQLTAGQVTGAGLVVAGLTVLAVCCRRRLPALLVGWLWFLGTLVPVIGLVQVGWQGLADRYTYFPLIGIFVALAWALPEPLVGRTLLATGAAGVLAVCLILTWLQLRHWRDEGTVWRHTLEVTQNNPDAHLSLGTYLYLHGQVDEAEAQFTRALHLAPRYVLALNNLGDARLREGRVDEALALLLRATESNPHEAIYQNNLGLVWLRRGQFDRARRCFEEAIRREPDRAIYHANLAFTLEEQGHPQAAGAAYRAARERDSGWPLWANRLAGQLLRAEHPKLRCPPEALLRARQACAASDTPRAELLDTLASAYAATGNYPQAVASARQGLELARAANQADLMRQLQSRLENYQAAAQKTP